MSTRSDSSLIQFSSEMRQRRLEAGRPSYERIVKLATAHQDSLSKSTITNLLGGRFLPRWESVRAYLYAVLRHENPDRTTVELDAEVGRWRKRWVEVSKPLPLTIDPETDEPTISTYEVVPPPTMLAPTSAESVALPDVHVPMLKPRVDRSANDGSKVLSISAETALRELIFGRLRELVDESGGAVTRQQLWEFTVDGQTHRLIDRNRGIRNPSYLNASLSILTVAKSPRDEEDLGDSLFSYSYSELVGGGDNRKLRRAYELQLPLVLLRVIRPGAFVPIFPVWVVGDDTANRRFLISADHGLPEPPAAAASPQERRFVTGVTRARIGQAEFRAAVLHAYDYRCAVCGLGQRTLLAVSHIVPIHRTTGISGVENALCLCAIHHSAFEQNLLGVTPDCEVRIKQKIMNVTGDNMLHYVLQAAHTRALFHLPRKRSECPSAEMLAKRFADFQKADSHP
ncbi:HNH endonuclease [Nocardia fluminea]|uniref:HNH endonuclease n=1 Tax=Nocardia fluminea TaxID=134984 RepID=UPI0036704BAB